MTLSNICKVSALAVSLAVISAPTTVEAATASSMVEKVVKYVAKKGGGAMCKKGNILNGIVSLRSFSGALCNATQGTAGFAIATCLESNTDDFRNSGCFKNAVKKLGVEGQGDAEIMSAATAAMAADIGKAGSEVAKLACTKASSLPDGAAKNLALAKCGG